MKQLVWGMALTASLVTTAPAQVLLSGGTYSQNFDTLASLTTGNPYSWADNTTLVGWYAGRGTNAPLTTYNAGTGSSTTGSLYSFGSTNSSDRALGSVASGATSNLTYGVRLRNDTVNSFQDFTISYTGEQWRNGNNINAQSLQFSYKVGNSPITGADALNGPGLNGWVAFGALDFTGPVHTATPGAALDGNASANRTAFSSVALTGVNLNPGDELFLRWFDPNDSGNDHGLGIDDLSVSFTATPVPEPREYAMVAGLGLLGLAAYRRWSLRRA